MDVRAAAIMVAVVISAAGVNLAVPAILAVAAISAAEEDLAVALGAVTLADAAISVDVEAGATGAR